MMFNFFTAVNFLMAWLVHADRICKMQPPIEPAKMKLGVSGPLHTALRNAINEKDKSLTDVATYRRFQKPLHSELLFVVSEEACAEITQMDNSWQQFHRGLQVAVTKASTLLQLQMNVRLSVAGVVVEVVEDRPASINGSNGTADLTKTLLQFTSHVRKSVVYKHAFDSAILLAWRDNLTLSEQYVSYVGGYTGVVAIGNGPDGDGDKTDIQLLGRVIAEAVARNLGIKDDKTRNRSVGTFSKNQLIHVRNRWNHSRIHNRMWNAPTKLYYKLPICGNGIVEEGEACDCGVFKPCPSCPNCQYRAKHCGGECCSKKNHTLFKKGHECRAYDHCDRSLSYDCGVDKKCDLKEYCDGEHDHCPTNRYKADGVPCSKGHSCYEGKCRNDIQVEDSCSAKCHGHGVCDNRGKCYCNDRFAPETDCRYRGVGGSTETGPNNVPPVNKALSFLRDHMVAAIGGFIILGCPFLAILTTFCHRCCKKFKVDQPSVRAPGNKDVQPMGKDVAVQSKETMKQSREASGHIRFQ